MHREMTQAREDANDTEALRAVGQIGAINGIWQIRCTHTRMRVGAVARVTQDAWQALAVHNELGRGLAVGDYLDVDTTLCKLVLSPKELMASGASLPGKAEPSGSPSRCPSH